MSASPFPPGFLTVPLAELPADFKQRALQWGAVFPHCAYFEPNGLDYPYGPFAHLVAVAPAGSASLNSLQELGEMESSTPNVGLRCGFVTYDAKNDIEALSSKNFAGFGWPQLHFFSSHHLALLARRGS